jgi:DNA-binding GntR family transcriptional regulator
VATVPRFTLLKCDHGLRRKAIVQSLLTEVFQGHLRAGQHLVTQELAARFGVSHTPVREALIALAGLGIIDLVPNRGAVIRRVSAKEVREMGHVRRVLECEAVRGACGRIDRTELRAQAVRLRRLVAIRAPGHTFIDEARAIDTWLHDRIAGSSGNAFLANEIGRLKLLFQAFRDVSYGRDEAHQDFCRLTVEAHEHLAIVDALLGNDRRAALCAMSRHIRAGLNYWCRVLAEAAGELGCGTNRDAQAK